MPGAGTAELAFAKEESLMGTLVDADADGTPEYYAFGRNPTLTDISLDNALARMRDTGDVEAAESIAQNFEGAVAVDAVVSNDVHGDVEDIIFNSGGTSFAPGQSASAAIFAGVDYIGGTVERELTGCIPLDYSINYEQGGVVTYSLSMAYADETKNTSITPSAIVQVSDGSSVPHHGVTLTIDAASVTKLQSATLSISNIARYHRGTDRNPVDAVIGAVETSLETNAIISRPDHLELAYGASAATSPQDSMSSVAGSLKLAVGGTIVTTVDLPQLKPANYSWGDLVNDDADTTEQISWHVNGGVSVS